jgi:hypothetical protein
VIGAKRRWALWLLQTRLLCAHARVKGFATAEVQIPVNDTPLHRLETVYRRLVERITTDADGAFRAVVDGWLYALGDEVRRLRGPPRTTRSSRTR